jgi:hypothetical protein
MACKEIRDEQRKKYVWGGGGGVCSAGLGRLGGGRMRSQNHLFNKNKE